MTTHPMVEALGRYPLVQALRDRRSRRFGMGMEIPAGPLAHRSRHAPEPVSEEVEAALAWAATGITGPALADLTYAPGHGGNIMAGLAGRTVASGDGLQTVALVVVNDGGAWFVKRPENFAPSELPGLVELGRTGAWLELYRRQRVRLADRRVHPSMEPIVNIRANRWSAHAAGGSYFLPIGDLTPMYLNGLLEILNEDTRVFVVDERRGFRPAGLGRFAASRGGHLDDDPKLGRVITIRQLEQFVTDFVNLEMGMVLQNLGLMTQALGLGGYPHFANHDFAWFEVLGFRCEPVRASRYLAAGPLMSAALSLTGRNLEIPMAVSLERGGETLMRAMCPPNFASMKEALGAAIDRKFGERGIFRSDPGLPAWREQERVAGAVPRLGERAVAAAEAYVEYVWRHYGRFPVNVPPFRCGLAHQVVHVDAEFYDRHYRPGALSERQREDFEAVLRRRAEAAGNGSGDPGPGGRGAGGGVGEGAAGA